MGSMCFWPADGEKWCWHEDREEHRQAEEQDLTPSFPEMPGYDPGEE